MANPPNSSSSSSSSQPPRRGNNVRGPTSALTSFLKERGIRPSNINPYARRATADGNNDANTNAEDPIQSQTQSGAEPAISATTPEGDENTEMRAEMTAAPPPLKVTKNTTVKDKKRKRKEGDEADFDLDGDELKAGPRSGFSRKATKNAQEIVPSDYVCLRFCISCSRRYHGVEASTFCDACSTIKTGKAVDTGKKKPRRKQKAKDIIVNREDQMKGGVITLKESCVQAVIDNIDLVDCFGDIPIAIKTRISMILSKMRKLDVETMKLFLGLEEEDLRLYDCTNIESELYDMISITSPNLKYLYLAFVGRLQGPQFLLLAKGLEHLTKLTLKGAFRVSDEAFAAAMPSLSQLDSIALENASKIGPGAITAMVKHCAQLSTVGLTYCGRLGDEAVSLLSNLSKLQSLDLCGSGEHRDLSGKDGAIIITNKSLVTVITHARLSLKSLNLKELSYVSDDILKTIKLCENLSELELGQLVIKPEAFLEFLKPPHQLKLNRLSLRRCVDINDDCLVALMNVYGAWLKNLDLNGLDYLTEKGLVALHGTESDQLEEIDLGFVRALTDELLGRIVTGAFNFAETETPNWSSQRSLRKMTVFGCQRLSEFSTQRRWTRGEVEIRVIGGEFD